jgi:hypothetical protein
MLASLRRERHGSIVLRIDDEGEHGNFGARGAVGQQRAAQLLPLECSIDRQTSDAGHGHGGIARQPLPERLRQVGPRHAARRQRVVVAWRAR